MSRKWKPEPEPMVLVGFGKHDLVSLMGGLNSPEGEDKLLYALDRDHWPPRYRRASICTDEEIRTFGSYVKWVNEKLGVKNV